MFKSCLFTLLILCTALMSVAQLRELPEKPTGLGGRWTIAEKSPGPFWYEGNMLDWVGGDACDFAIYQSDDGKWHLQSCIRLSVDLTDRDRAGNPIEIPRYFFRWESDSLTTRMWTRAGMGIFHEGGARDSIQAPSPFTVDGKHYLVINKRGANIFESPDGRAWQQIVDGTGDAHFFDVGRDVMIFDDREGTGKWYGYFLQNPNAENTKPYVAAVSADSLMGPWLPAKGKPAINILKDADVNPESPFVVRRGKDDYYLWSQFGVRHAKNPLDFSGSKEHKTLSGIYAPEILHHNGKWFATGYGNSIWVEPMSWVSDKEANVDLAALTLDGVTLTPAFFTLRDRYAAVVPADVTRLAVTATPAGTKAKVTISGNENLQAGLNEVQVTVDAENALDRRIYTIGAYRLTAEERTYPLTVSNGLGSGSYPAGMPVPIEGEDRWPKASFTGWSGDITALRDAAHYQEARTAEVRMPAQAAKLEATYTPTYPVTYQITDAVTDKPIFTALVTLNGMAIFSSREGRSVFPRVQGGLHSYLISARGYRGIASTVQVNGPMTIEIRLQPVKPLTLTLHLQGPEGPVAGQRVRLEGSTGRMEKTTGDDGLAAFTGLVTGEYRYEVMNNVYNTPWLPGAGVLVLREDAGTLTVPMRRNQAKEKSTFTFRLQVTDEAGTAIPEAEIVGPGYTLTTNAAGEASVLARPGSARDAIRVSKVGFIPSLNVLTSGKDLLETVVLRLLPEGGGRTVTFTVLHEDRPVTGALLRFNSMQTLTNAEGVAVFNGVPEGSWSYKLSVPNRAAKDEWGSLWVAKDLKYTMRLLKPLDEPARHRLTVSGGSGTGEISPGRQAVLEAVVPEGARFTGWTGDDAALLDDPTAVKTYCIMPARDVQVTGNTVQE